MKPFTLNKDKLYTEEDIKNAIKWLNKNYSEVEDELAYPLETNQVEFPDNFFESVYEEALNRSIQSLQPKTEWDIEVEMEYYKDSKVYDQPDTLLDEPIFKITNNSIKIIKQYEK
jgi:hypothetical protein